MNVITLTGNAVKDLDLRYTPNGKAVANGSIAVRRDRANQNGDYETDFFSFVALGKTAEIMTNHIKKGDFFGITGRLQNRTWEKDDGSKSYFTEVLVNSFDWPTKKSNTGNAAAPPTGNTGNAQPPKDSFEGGGIDIKDDDLPF